MYIEVQIVLKTDDTNLCKELEHLVSDVLDSKQTTVKTERRFFGNKLYSNHGN